MAYVIIQKKDKNKMAAMVEDILYTAGDLMRCVEDMREEEYGDRYGERGGYGNRGGMGMRDGGRYGNRGGYGNREWDDEDEMNERRYRRRY